MTWTGVIRRSAPWNHGQWRTRRRRGRIDPHHPATWLAHVLDEGAIISAHERPGRHTGVLVSSEHDALLAVSRRRMFSRDYRRKPRARASANPVSRAAFAATTLASIVRTHETALADAASGWR